MELVTPGFGLIFWQTVTFLIVVFVLGKYAWNPILGSLKERESSIASALSSAEKAKEELANLKAENEKLLDEARLERDKILKEATEAANRLKDTAKEDASKIGAKMVQEAKLAIQNEKKAAMEEVKNELASLSLDIAEKLLRKNLDNDESQKELVNSFIKDLNIN